MKTKVQVYCYPDGAPAIFHGRELADYNAQGCLLAQQLQAADIIILQEVVAGYPSLTAAVLDMTWFEAVA